MVPPTRREGGQNRRGPALLRRPGVAPWRPPSGGCGVGGGDYLPGPRPPPKFTSSKPASLAASLVEATSAYMAPG